MFKDYNKIFPLSSKNKTEENGRPVRGS